MLCCCLVKLGVFYVSLQSGRSKIWSHVNHKTKSIVAEVRERRSLKANISKDRKEEVRVTLQGDDWEAQQHLKVNGQLSRRLFGISKADEHGGKDSLVAMSWGAVQKGRASPNNEKDWYVMEISPGIDAALMVALAVIVDEVRSK